MLTISINNNSFFLNQNSSVKLEWYNPFFSFDEFSGDRGVNIEIPVNPRNRSLLGNPERFEKQTTSTEFMDCEIRFSGWLLMSGTLVVQSANSENYSCFLRGTVGNVGKTYREKNINELHCFMNLKTFENKASYVPSVDDYCCPTVFNPYFFEGIGKNMPDEEIGVLDYRFRMGNSAGYVNAKGNGGFLEAPYSQANITTHPENLDIAAVCPMLHVTYVLKTLLKSAGIEIDLDYIASNFAYSSMAVYSNYDITRMMYSVEGLWQILYWLDENEVKGKAKYFDTLTRDYGGFFQYNMLLPKISFKDFVISVQNITNTFIHFKDSRTADILDREIILTGTPADIDKYRVGEWIIGQKEDKTLKFEYDPDNDDLIFSEKFKSIDDRRTDLGEPVNNWTDLENIANPAFGEIRYLKELDIYAEYKWTEKIEINAQKEEVKTNCLGWEHLSIGCQNGFYNYGKDESKTIASKMSSVYSGASMFGIPVAKQRGNMGSLKYSFQNTAPRFILNSNFWANLQWEGVKGIIASRYAVTAPFLSSLQQVISEFAFPVNALDFMIRKLPYKFRTREGEFLIEKMETEFSYNEFSTTTITAYKV
jgi:hypothetical protein